VTFHWNQADKQTIYFFGFQIVEISWIVRMRRVHRLYSTRYLWNFSHFSGCNGFV
jgi:hypothetical protein